MGLRPIHLIGLIAWAVVTWDRTLFVEATDQENKNVSSVLDSRLPPGIVVPLPYVYPEYTDPRELTTPSPTTQDDRAMKTSVSDVILLDVTNTMLQSMDEVMQIMDADGSDLTVKIGIEESRNSSSVSSNNNETMVNKPMMSSESKVEIKRRPSENRLRFGTRIKNVTKTVSNEKPYRPRSSSIRVAARNMPANSTRNDDDVSTTTKRPVSRVRKVVTRRRRPNAENSTSVRTSVRRPVKVKNTEPEGELENVTETASRTI